MNSSAAAQKQPVAAVPHRRIGAGGHSSVLQLRRQSLCKLDERQALLQKDMISQNMAS